ncbi:unnamed protein product, partial [Mesorhabditis spiculigera]
MKLLSLISFATLLAAGASCGCETFAMTFTERVATLFWDRSAYYAIITEFQNWVTANVPDPYNYDNALYAQQFITVLTSYEQGGLASSVPSTPPTDADTEQYSYWIFGLTACVNGLYNDYATYQPIIQQA